MIQRPWANLLHSVRTGKTAFDAVFGVSLFDYFAAHPQAAELFTAGMAARTAEHLAAIVAAHDWRGLDTIAPPGKGAPKPEPELPKAMPLPID